MKISVITVCYNAEEEIAATLRSILVQEYNDFELILIDGQSKDKTIKIASEIIKQSEIEEDRFLIISEKDNGVFDAMNKGVQNSTGEYIIFMNCGDLFYDSSILSKFDHLIKFHKDCDVIYGNTLMEFYEGKGIYHEEEGSSLNPIMPFIHQSAITKRQALISHPFDTTFKICADLEFYHWMRKKQYKFYHADFIVSIYNARDGLSEENPLQIRREKDKIFGLNQNSNYWFIKIIQRLTIGLIQPIKRYAPRKLLNFYFRKKKTYINWI